MPPNQYNEEQVPEPPDEGHQDSDATEPSDPATEDDDKKRDA
jgi:hypothetical protein